MARRPDRPGEDDLIARYLAPLAGPEGLGLRDDAALLAPTPGHELVLTSDAIASGIHYLPDDPPASIGRKALGVNVSDLVAKGATPRGYLLTLALAEDWSEEWLAGLCQGLGEAAREFGFPLLGGDTIRAPGPSVIGVAALGEVPAGGFVRRTSARPGDRICVTGTIGDAALGLALRRERAARWARDAVLAHRAFLADRYLHPRPRLATAALLRAHATAAMDVSDGLAGDLAKMMRASGTSATVQVGAVPLSAAVSALVAAEPGLLDRALTGGDDYEVLCTVPPDALGSFLAAAGEAAVPVAVIGTVEAGDGPPRFRDPDGAPRVLGASSFSHF